MDFDAPYDKVDPQNEIKKGMEQTEELKHQKAELLRASQQQTAPSTSQESPDAAKPKRAFELNLDPSYWRYKFLYPFALDPAPLRLDAERQKPEEVIKEKKRLKMMSDESLMETKKYQFPVGQIKKKDEFLDKIAKPITMSLEDIMADMNTYAKQFPTYIIPHLSSDREIVDPIHNYQRPKKQQTARPLSHNGTAGKFRLDKDDAPEKVNNMA